MDTYIVGVNNGGIVGGEGNTVNNSNSCQKEELDSLLTEIQSAINRMEVSQGQKEDAKEYIDAIANEASQSKPKKSIIKIACDGLKKLSTDDSFLALIGKLMSIIVK